MFPLNDTFLNNRTTPMPYYIRLTILNNKNISILSMDWINTKELQNIHS